MESTTGDLLSKGRHQEVWDRYCGFLDFDVSQYMSVQNHLLAEQLELFAPSELGRAMFRGAKPRNIHELREVAPLTTYSDYVSTLGERNEDVLPVKPKIWIRTSGRSGYYSTKWVPFTEAGARAAGIAAAAPVLAGAAKRKGDVRMKPDDVLLHTVAPAPYASGALFGPTLSAELPIRWIPSLEVGDAMPFQERIQLGFRMAMRDGIDYFFGIGSVLARIGEMLSQGIPRGGQGMPPEMKNAKAISRIIRGVVRSKLARRPLYPKDLWRPKAILAGGGDAAAYADAIEMYWGIRPTDIYGSTEYGAGATQIWTHAGLTLFPFTNFWEFIPYDEHLRAREDPQYQPRTVLFDELKTGIYEIVGTNFHGGALVRYRIGDLFNFISLEDKEAGVKLPQFVFETRGDDVLDIAGFTRLTEKTFIMALADASIRWEDWCVVKEVGPQGSRLHFYLEPKRQASHISESDVAHDLHEALKRADADYRSLEEMLQVRPISVTLIEPGSFQRYMLKQQERGADLGHLKVPRMQPGERQLADLLGAPNRSA
jgi:hypothetical protein